jgi:hypothetical protein
MINDEAKSRTDKNLALKLICCHLDHTYFKALGFGAVHDFKQKGGQNVEALAIANCFIPTGVSQQHPL